MPVQYGMLNEKYETMAIKETFGRARVYKG